MGYYLAYKHCHGNAGKGRLSFLYVALLKNSTETKDRSLMVCYVHVQRNKTYYFTC
jgi:hypothetical protein